MSDARLEVTDALGRRIVPIIEGAFRDRPPRDERSAPRGQRGVARSRGDRLAGQPVRRSRQELALRDLRQRRAGHRADARPRRSRQARPDWRRGDGVPARRERARDRARDDDRHRRPSPDRRAPRRSSGARIGPRARRRAGARARLGHRGQRRRARLHHARGSDRRTRVQDGAVARPRDDPERDVRHQPQDSRGSLPHRGAAHRRGPARRRSRQRPHGDRRARHQQRAVRAPSPRPLSRSGRGRRRGSPHRRALPRQPRKGIADVELDARRARDARDRSGRRHREREAVPRDDGEGADGAGDADRGRDPAGAAAEGRTRGRVLPCRRRVAAVPVDRRRLLRLRRPLRRLLRLRPRGRRRQGPARGAPERDDAGHLRRAGRRQRLAVEDDHEGEPGAVPPRHRIAVRHAHVRIAACRTDSCCTATPVTIRRW